MGELLPSTPGPVRLSNEQRYRAALTIAESSDPPILLQALGLAECLNGYLYSRGGVDQEGMTWWQAHHRDLAARRTGRGTQLLDQ